MMLRSESRHVFDTNVLISAILFPASALTRQDG
jgi:predicted nucleic acid-binding protein